MSDTGGWQADNVDVVFRLGHGINLYFLGADSSYQSIQGPASSNDSPIQSAELPPTHVAASELVGVDLAFDCFEGSLPVQTRRAQKDGDCLEDTSCIQAQSATGWLPHCLGRSMLLDAVNTAGNALRCIEDCC